MADIKKGSYIHKGDNTAPNSPSNPVNTLDNNTGDIKDLLDSLHQLVDQIAVEEGTQL